MRDDTAEGTRPSLAENRRAQPGIVVLFSSGKRMCMPLALRGNSITLGRMPGTAGILLPDDRLSRLHAEITRTDDGWAVRDAGSRNGTFVDGEPVIDVAHVRAPRVIRLADTIILPIDDIASFDSFESGGTDPGPIVGWRLRQALDAIAQAAAADQTLVIQGESGTGKELAARAFHAAGPHARGPFVAVNCAAIPEGLAERLLFGAKRGAYSGASADATGHLQAAHGGVLFLDEVGDLDLQVQAKLLRVLETRDVVPLGASAGQRVDVRVCVATHRNLRAAVADGRFRADLYYRLAPPEVTMPPLRERLDEIPGHVTSEIASVSPALGAHARLVEACFLRRWPGNVRELRKEIHHAATRALAEGSNRVRFEHLSAAAGLTLVADAAPEIPAPAATAVSPPLAPEADRKRSYVRWSQSVTREQVESALAQSGGKVAEAARSLGMHRSQLYREMARWSVRGAVERPAPDQA
jgi:DNA-binding NtrC family response regulator